MKTSNNTGVDDKEQWRNRILRALSELRQEDVAKDGRLRRDDARDEGASNDAKP